MKYLILISASALISSCAPRVLYDRDTQEKYSLTSEDLMHIQFYNTSDIVLNRYEKSPTETTAGKGALMINEGQSVEQVIIKSNTKGKVVKVLDGDKLAVSFEPDDSKFLVFGPRQNSKVYFPQAIDWVDGRGTVEYGGKLFQTSPGADQSALAFRLKREYRENRKSRVAKGNKVH